MGSVYLIRHGQASFGKADYDALSEKGHQQSRLLGEHLRARITPTRLISGAMTRHKETYTGFLNGYIDCVRDTSIQESSSPLPELEIDAGFNEFDHVEVMVRHRPEWADQRVMAQDLAKSKVPRKVFQYEFETAIARWACGDFDGEYQESWPQFQARVIASLNQVLSTAERSQDILIFTSGGPIALICAHVLQMTPNASFAMNNVIANASISRLVFSSDPESTRKTSLSYFNSFSHLDGTIPSMLTYR